MLEPRRKQDQIAGSRLDGQFVVKGRIRTPWVEKLNGTRFGRCLDVIDTGDHLASDGAWDRKGSVRQNEEWKRFSKGSD